MSKKASKINGFSSSDLAHAIIGAIDNATIVADRFMANGTIEQISQDVVFTEFIGAGATTIINVLMANGTGYQITIEPKKA